MLIEEMSQALKSNYDEFQKYVKVMEEGYRAVEGEIVAKMKEQEQTINEQRDQNKQVSEELEKYKMESEKAQKDR